MRETPVKHLLNQFNNSQLVHYLLLLALGWSIAQLLSYFQTIVVIFTIAAILAFLLHYPVKGLVRFMPRWGAIAIVLLLSLLLIGGLVFTVGFALLSQAQQLVETAPDLINQLLSITAGLESFFEQRNIEFNLDAIADGLRDQALAGLGVGLATFQAMLSRLVDLILIVVIAFFMLLDGNSIWKLFLKLFPRSIRDDLTIAIQHNFLGFFWGRFLLSVFFGVSAFGVFLWLDIPYALILSAIAGLFDLIPGIGATLGISLIALIVLPQGAIVSLKVLIVCVLLQQIEENLLMPRIMQGSININPVIMFFALLMGARIAGLFGVFISIPITGVLINLFERYEDRREELASK